MTKINRLIKRMRMVSRRGAISYLSAIGVLGVSGGLFPQGNHFPKLNTTVRDKPSYVIRPNLSGNYSPSFVRFCRHRRFESVEDAVRAVNNRSYSFTVERIYPRTGQAPAV